MSRDNMKKLQVEFPVLFSQPCGFWCDDGWFGPIRGLAPEEITRLAEIDGLQVAAA